MLPEDLLMDLSPQRRSLYRRVDAVIGNTGMVLIDGLNLGNQNRIYAKREYRNPTGSHYDREMLRFLLALEATREIRPERDRMLETTTGNSGAAFAWLCAVLGYKPPYIIIPADMPHARRKQIESFGAELILSEPGKYISGIATKYGETLLEFGQNGTEVFTPRHWNDETHCVAAMVELGDEILSDVAGMETELDAFILALGNGSSARGVGQVLRRQSVTLYGMEPAESPIIAEYTGLMKPREGSRTHGLIGTGPHELSQVYRNMRWVADQSMATLVPEKRMLEDIFHPTNEEVLEMKYRLSVECFEHVGMSSAASVVAACRLLDEHGLRNHSIGLIFYDPAWKYL